VQVDDTLGADAAVGGVCKGLANAKREPVAYEKDDRTKADFGPLIPKV
jgi:hypothetical protein